MAVLSLPAIATIAGLVSHQGLFIYGEWHLQSIAIMFIYIGIFLILPLILRLAVTSSLLSACLQAVYLTICYASALLSSMVVYRLFLHRCCGFPGPSLARISNLWHAWNGRNSENHIWLDKLHHQYGDFVRTGPCEITVFDAAGFRATCGFGTKCTKSVWYDFMQPNVSIVNNRDEKMHDERRRVWRQALGPEALESYEPRILQNVDKLDHIISDAASEGRPVDVVSLSYWFGFDIMGEFTFNKSFGMLDNARYHDVIVKLRKASEVLGPFTPVLWLARLVLVFLPGVGRLKEWIEVTEYCHQQMKERLTMAPDRPDIASYLIEDHERSGRSEMNTKLLYGDSVSVTVAGSDTSAALITFTLYLLAKFPEQAEKLYAELNNVDIRDAHALKYLPHLSGVIDEALRLYPVIPTAVQRETPPEGLMIGARYIPGKTVVNVPRYTIGRMERYFVQADQFIPERWHSRRRELVKNESAHVPFSLGRYSCLGQSLALMDVKFVISRVVTKHRISFVPGTDPELVHTRMQDNFTISPGPLSLTFTPRE